MARNVAIDLEHVFTFRQRNVKTGEWRERKFTLGEMYEAHIAESEEAGKDPLPLGEWLADMAQYGCRREMALDKDQTRFDKGLKPHTAYTARSHGVQDARKNADQVREEAKARLEAALRLGHRTVRTAKPSKAEAKPAARPEAAKVEAPRPTESARRVILADEVDGSDGKPVKPFWMVLAERKAQG